MVLSHYSLTNHCLATIKVKEDAELFVLNKDDLEDLILKNSFLRIILNRIVSKTVKDIP